MTLKINFGIKLSSFNVRLLIHLTLPKIIIRGTQLSSHSSHTLIQLRYLNLAENIYCEQTKCQVDKMAWRQSKFFIRNGFVSWINNQLHSVCWSFSLNQDFSYLASVSGTVVEHLTHNTKNKGSYPTPDTTHSSWYCLIDNGTKWFYWIKKIIKSNEYKQNTIRLILPPKISKTVLVISL